MKEEKETFENAHICDYCGNWVQNLMMNVWRDNEKVWQICEPCWIKAFDTVLGRPGDSK